MIEKVEIGPITYKIDDSEEGITRIQIEENQAAIRGFIHYSKSVITLDPKSSDGQKRAYLMHEIFHGILEELGIKPFNNEDIVIPVANEMLDTLRRNPQLVAFLMEGVNG